MTGRCACHRCRPWLVAREVCEGLAALCVVLSVAACLLGLAAALSGQETPFPVGTGYLLAEMGAAGAAGSWAVLVALTHQHSPYGRGS